MLGISFEKPVRHLREYLSILMPLAARRARRLGGRDPHRQAGARRPRRAGRAGAGRRARRPDARRRRPDGRRHGHLDDRPHHHRLAHRPHPGPGGRPRPVAPHPGSSCALPVCVTDDEADARAAAGERFGGYGFLPVVPGDARPRGCGRPGRRGHRRRRRHRCGPRSSGCSSRVPRSSWRFPTRTARPPSRCSPACSDRGGCSDLIGPVGGEQDHGDLGGVEQAERSDGCFGATQGHRLDHVVDQVGHQVVADRAASAGRPSGSPAGAGRARGRRARPRCRRARSPGGRWCTPSRRG